MTSSKRILRVPTSLRLLAAFLVFIGSLGLGSSVEAAGDAWYGLVLNIDADGIVHPIVRSITVKEVFPASPAAQARVAVRDVIVAMQGIKIAGAKGEMT